MAEIPKDTERWSDSVSARALGVDFDGLFPSLSPTLEQLASRHIQMQNAQIAVLHAELRMTHRAMKEYRALAIGFAIALLFMFAKFCAK